MDMRAYLQIIRRRWWLLVMGPVLAGLAAFAVSKQLTPVYSTSATLLINQTQVPGTVQYNDILTSERLTNTYAQLIKRDQIFSDVRTRLDLPLTTDQISSKISVSTISNTQLLRITVEDPSPKLAADIANTTATAFIDDNANSLGRPGTVSVAEDARVPTSPSKPNIKLNTALAAMMGLLVVGCLVFVLEYLDDAVKPTDDTEAELGVTTLGVVRRLKPEKRLGRPAPLANETSEAYLQLRTNVHFAGVGTKLKTLVVTSSSPGEGKSTTAAGLAVVMAQAGERVIIVDTDLRRSTLHEIFQVPNSFGLTGLLLSDVEDPSAALIDPGIKNLQVLPSGPLPPNPADLLMSSNMEHIMKRLSERADYVIFDSPPVLAVTDATILAGRTDGTILVAQAGATRKPALQRVIRDLEPTQARLVGLVINKVRPRGKGYYGYGYYSYGYERFESATGETQRTPSPPTRRAA